jgi:acetyltransferase
VAVLSDGGGQGTLAVDALEAAGVVLADLATGTRSALAELLGPAAAVANPVDLAGAADADPGRFVEAFERLTADPAVGAVLMVGLFGGYALRFDPALAEVELAAAAGLARAARTSGTTLLVHSVYAPEATPALLALRTEQVPVVESLEVACRCVGALAERGRALAAPAWEPLALGRSPGETGPVSALSEPEARGLLADAGVPLVPAVLCAGAVEAVEAAERWPEATVLKAVADGLAHKSDHGGVALGLEGAEAVRVAFERMRTAVEAAGFAFRGALAAPHLGPPLAELLVGVHVDPTFGPVLTVGAGGVWVEADGDTALRLLPVGEADVRAMLGELRIAARLAGLRGRPPADVPSVVAVALALARLVGDHPSVVEAEINPLFVYADRAVAVDARAYVASDSPAGAAGAADAPAASAPAAPPVSRASASTGSSS